MEIELNKIYKAANGARVTIRHKLFQEQFDHFARAEYYDAALYTPEEILYTMPLQYLHRNGVSNRDSREWDIVSEWREDDSLPTITFQEVPFKGSVLEKHILLGNESIWLSHKAGCEGALRSKRSQFFEDALTLIKQKLKIKEVTMK